MEQDWIGEYRLWLSLGSNSLANSEKNLAKETILHSMKNSAAYQADATRNGKLQPMVVTRKTAEKCKMTALPEDNIYAGDIVSAFGNTWLCVEAYKDEYGISYGELWLCNHVFVYQFPDGQIVRKHAVLDGGSYSKGTDKSIPITNNTFNCYVSMDDDCKALYIDKRLGLGVIYDSSGSPILDVGKICWIDSVTRNQGNGSHLLAFGLADDVYDREKDDIDLLICDYIPTEMPLGEEKHASIYIEGRDSARIGTTRTYKATVINSDGTSCPANNAEWRLVSSPEGVTIQRDLKNDCAALLSVPLQESIVGHPIRIECFITDSDGNPIMFGEKEIGVITIG